jgi:hypothetical protein
MYVLKGPYAMMALYTWFLTEVRANDVDFYCLCTDQAVASLFVAIHVAEPWAEIAISKMSVRQ